MAILRDALKTFLAADETLSGLLPGGVLDINELPQTDYGLTNVPRSGAVISPFAVIRWRGTVGKEIIGLTERRTVEIYVYEARRGYAIIEQAKRRIKTILNRTQIQADDAGIAMFHWQTSGGLFPAQELNGASGEMIRYYVDYEVIDS
jgi:hypothetical protein